MPRPPRRLRRLGLPCALLIAGALGFSLHPVTRPGDLAEFHQEVQPADPAPPPPHNCRFWSMVGTGYPPGMVADQLRDGSVASLKGLSHINRDGWGIASFLRPEMEVPLFGPIIRRGGPPAYHPGDPDFDLAVDELEALRPRAAVAHIRLGSSGHWGVPDPHPFQSGGYVFAHNGGVPVDSLVAMLSTGDEYYLDHHPPDWTAGYVDSELYFLYLMKRIRGSAPSPTPLALVRAVNEIVDRVGETWLNFALTAGDTLYALRYATYDTSDPVRFYPASPAGTPQTASPFWVAASQIVGSTTAGWGTIPPHTLAVFVPGEPPRFFSVTAGGSAREGESRDGPALEPAVLRSLERSEEATGVR